LLELQCLTYQAKAKSLSVNMVMQHDKNHHHVSHRK